MRDEIAGDVAAILFRVMDTAKRTAGEWAAVAATHWLEVNGAGCPEVPLMQERIRDDAALWASCAHQAELEAYLSSSLLALEKSVLTEKASKRLAALSYKSLSPEDRAAFIEWAKNQ